MKKNDIQKMSKKTVADLTKDLASSREEVRGLKFELASGKVKNIVKIKEAKKKIARIMTFMKQAVEK